MQKGSYQIKVDGNIFYYKTYTVFSLQYLNPGNLFNFYFDYVWNMEEGLLT